MKDIFVLTMTNVTTGSFKLVMAYSSFAECAKFAELYNAYHDGYKYEVVHVDYLY